MRLGAAAHGLDLSGNSAIHRESCTAPHGTLLRARRGAENIFVD
jgi:hypothetical protein